MAAFLDALGIDRVHVVGWSDGGIVGLELAYAFPEKVDKLVAISANFRRTGNRDINRVYPFWRSLGRS